MEAKLQQSPKREEPTQLQSNGQMPAMSPPTLQLQASKEPMQRLKDPIEGSKQASIIGAASMPVRETAAADGKKVGDFAKGAEVEIVEVSGAFTKVKGKDKTSANEITGFVPSANVSTRARQLGQIATALDADMDDIYKKSFNADKTVVEEWGATVIEKDGVYSAKNKRTGHDGGSLPGGYKMDVDAGEQVIGGVHSHPYSKDEGLAEGVAFSGGDIAYMRNHVKKGFQHWAEAGTARFTLVIEDETKAQKYFDDNTTAKIQTSWNTNFGAAKGTFQERVIEAVKKTIGDNGIDFYGTFDGDKKKFDKL